MLKVHVKNLNSPRTGKPVANQFVIKTPEGEYFQSYSSVIAFRNSVGGVLLDQKYWDFSITTSKYRNIFLGETKKETLAKIESAHYSFINLN